MQCLDYYCSGAEIQRLCRDQSDTYGGKDHEDYFTDSEHQTLEQMAERIDQLKAGFEGKI